MKRIRRAASMAVSAIAVLAALGLGAAGVRASGGTSAPLYHAYTDAVVGTVSATATSAGGALQLVITLQGEQAQASYLVNVCLPDPLTGGANCITPTTTATFSLDTTGSGSTTVSISDATDIVVVTVVNAADASDSATAVVLNPAPAAPDMLPSS